MTWTGGRTMAIVGGILLVIGIILVIAGGVVYVKEKPGNVTATPTPQPLTKTEIGLFASGGVIGFIGLILLIVGAVQMRRVSEVVVVPVATA